MSENLVHTKSHILLEEHNKINKRMLLEEDVDYWQDKLLGLKLNKVKEDFEYSKKKKSADKEINTLRENNKELKGEMKEAKGKLETLQNEDKVQIDKLKNIREEIKLYEEKNSELHSDFVNKINYVKCLQNPDNLMKHLLKFDQETLKSLCIKLNKIQSEKLNYMMTMQQQYYNQMMYNQGFIPMGVRPPMPNPDSAGNDDQEDNQHIN